MTDPSTAAPARKGASPDAGALADAFGAFNRFSEQLAESYRDLERRAGALAEELASARGERMRELVAKERIASRLGHLLECLPVGVLVVDARYRVTEANPVAEEMLGGPLVGMSWPQVQARAFAGAGELGTDWRLRDGRTVSVAIRPLRREPGCLLLIHDVTEQRRLAAEAARQRRLGAMGEMTARLAHQIRTPLAAALLHAEALLHPGADSAQRRRSGERLVARLHRIEEQVAGLLRFARGERPTLVEAPLEPLLGEVRAALEPHAQASGASLAVCEPGHDARVLADPKQVVEALTTLGINALQACGGGGHVSIAARTGASAVRLVVTDDGPGVPPELAERVFEPFFTTRADGTGLGLAVVRDIARANGGRVWVERASPRGAAFVIELPVPGSAPARVAAPMEGEAA